MLKIVTLSLRPLHQKPERGGDAQGFLKIRTARDLSPSLFSLPLDLSLPLLATITSGESAFCNQKLFQSVSEFTVILQNLWTGLSQRWSGPRAPLISAASLFFLPSSPIRVGIQGSYTKTGRVQQVSGGSSKWEH